MSTKLRPIRVAALLLGLLLAVLLLAGGPPPAAASTVVAYDLVSGGSQNLISYTNVWETGFTAPGDGFKKFQRGVNNSAIPFSLLDDSLSIFPSDNLGIIQEGNTDPFFGATDTVNDDTTGPVTAVWEFDISGASDLSLSINMGAMGDFEANDTFVWTYQIDGGPALTAISNSVDEDASLAYTLEGGGVFTLADPMLANGVLLNNVLQTISAPLTGSGNVLTLTLTASTDGGSEAFAFQDIIISGESGTPSPPQIVINEIMQNPAAVGDNAGEWFELYNADAADVDINGWTIKDDGSDSHVIANGGPLVVPAGGYLVLGNNATTSSNGGVNVAYSYGGGMFLSNSDDEVVLLDGQGAEIDRVNYDGGPLFPDPNGAAMALRDPALDNNDGANWCTAVTPYGAGDLGTPGAANDCDAPPPVFSCTGSDVLTLIHEVQGSGATSPLLNSTVVIDGVVVGDFQNNASVDNGELNGFYVQEETAQFDTDPATSEGVFIYAPGAAADVAVGDHVRVRGTVAEYTTSGGASSMTQIANPEIAVCDTPADAPAATPITLPVSAISDFEAFEGMLVTFPQGLSISEYFNFDRFNEVVLSVGRQYQPTAVEEPGSAAATAVAEANALARIMMDDGRSSQNSDPALHPNGGVFDLTNRFRGGDLVTGATGVIDDTFGLYRLQPVTWGAYTAVNPRTPAPEPVGGNLTVASFNVLNYFTTLDNSGPICGPLGNQDCRGADNAEELARQRAKIVAALAAIDADVVGLIEIENGATDAAVQDLVDGLNAATAPGNYDFIPTGPIGTDAIKVALIYKPGSVTPEGSYAILDSSVDARFLDGKNRPVLAQTFSDNSSGAAFTVAVNHLKSKGSACDDVGDPDLGDGAGNCNLTRLAAAQALVDWLASDPTGSGDPDFLIIGDLNAYDKEDPIDAILAGADDSAGTADDYTDLLAQFQGELAYSYVFDGQLGYLDYGLASSELLQQVTGTTAWHINADEPDILDYDTSFKKDAQDALYEPNAYRASDHDPVIVGLQLDIPNAAPVCSTAAPSIEVIWPPNHKMVPVWITGVTDPDGDPVIITVTAIFQDEEVLGTGSGSTAPDGAGVGTATAEVRAEREGSGNGRAYHIYFEAADSFDASCSGEVLVYVPKNKNKFGPRIDDGPLYDSTQP